MFKRSTSNFFLENAKELGVKDERILKLLKETPREKFLPKALANFAYLDQPLEIGEGQTCSQPSLVAYMISLLKPKSTKIVLEIGTGSGYQTALLAPLVKKVYSIERIESLYLEAKERLTKLGYQNIIFKLGDGLLGWPEVAPFDGIIVSAGIGSDPLSLLDQLKEGGILVAPVGPPGWQMLFEYRKKGAKIEKTEHFPVAFVPVLSGIEKSNRDNL